MARDLSDAKQQHTIDQLIKILNVFCPQMKSRKRDLGETKLSKRTITEKNWEESECYTVENDKYRKAKLWHQIDHS